MDILMSLHLDPFLQLVPKRAEALLRRLRAGIWRDRSEITVTATLPTPHHRRLAEVRKEAREPVPSGTAWGRLYDQRWFHAALPGFAPDSGNLYLEWRDQGEATLYVESVPYYGFDPAHRRVAIPPDTRELWIEGTCCQSGIWHPDATGLSPQGSRFDGAFLTRRDDAAWAAAHDLQALYDAMLFLRVRQGPRAPSTPPSFGPQPSVDNTTPLFRRLLHLLGRAVDAHDLHGIDAFRASIAAAMVEIREQRAVVRAVLTGHAHIDLVWLWPERIGEAKAVHTFATVNRLMSQYPEFLFAYSQPASYRAVHRRAPELFEAVRQRMQSGQWQATGAMDVESDTQLPCGEALARSFLLGQAEFQRMNGHPARLLWLPDVFGYSGCLPQLMRLTGVEWFFTTKLTWSAVNRFPYSSFLWRGFDGSEVVAHVTQNVGYNNSLDLDELDANACGHAQSAVHPEFLHPTGFGDGGGGPTEEMCERARRLCRLAGMPEITWDHPEAFFERLSERRDSLPAYQGEFYLEYHRGTYTTHSNLKAVFRAAERALQIREATAVATGVVPDLTEPWRRLVFAQFHDYIPGSSVAEVYDEGIPELIKLAEHQQHAAQQELSRDGGSWHVFNPLPQVWRGWVKSPDSSEAEWHELPPLSGVPVRDASVKMKSPAPVVATERSLTNGRVFAEIDDDGWLRRFAIDGVDTIFTGPAARAILYVDRPANFDAWDIDRHTLDLGIPVNTPAKFQLEQASPQQAVLAVTHPLGGNSQLTLRYILQAGEPVLRIEAEVDWREPQTLLKLHFPTAYRGVNARFGAAFGSALRGQLSGNLATEAQWEVPGSRWAAVSHDGESDGLAIITEAKYGFSARNGDLTVSLLRGARIAGHDDHAVAAPPSLSRLSVASPFSDQGRHVMRLAITRYASAEAELNPAALADTLFTEPVHYCGEPYSSGLLAVEGAPTLVPAWAMPVDGRCWVLRLHEVAGVPGRAVFCVAPGWSVCPCRLDGSIEKANTPLTNSVDFRPYEIVSVCFSRESEAL
ncbi:alpha-mannosidase [Termitidicoccus mucosus]|uniref:Glycoside hydrolase family 38 central domain-containing protein n=1 Tax=Termitidicoccus mucosus TaxID=1184151 RepID=A0A178IP38_9BACT|nr:hypothetical protein AW736_02345 [Opitutaceae bacterium TSB47]